MSNNFLNNFSNRQYRQEEDEVETKDSPTGEEAESTGDDEKQAGASKDSTKADSSLDDTSAPKSNGKKFKRSSLDNKEPIAEEDEPIKPSIKLRGDAFKSEEVTIDPTFNEYRFKRTLVVCITIIAVVIIAIGTYMVLNFDKAVTLTGKTEADAVALLEEENIKYDVSYEINAEVEAGNVISQSIPAGETIGIFDMQLLVVSSGADPEENVDLSKLVSKKLVNIEEFIADNNLTNATITYENSDSVAQDILIRVDFDDDTVNLTNYRRKDKVTYVISKGKVGETKNIVVENFKNKTYDDVSTWGTEKGIIIEKEEVVDDKPAGYVLKQDVAYGTKLGAGDVLTVTVSKGPGEATPNFIGLTSAEAEELASDNSVTIETKSMYSDSVKAGVVMSQSIASGEPFFAETDTVKITVSEGKPFISDLSGTYVNEAITSITELNNMGANLTYEVIYVTPGKSDTEATKGTVQKTNKYGEYIGIGTHIKIYVYK